MSLVARTSSGPVEVAMDSKRKDGSRAAAAVVTEAGAQAVLRRGPARELSAEEEKVMRLRLGAALPRTSTLEWTDAELSEDQQLELQAMQIEAWMKWKAHLGAQRAGKATAAAPARTTTAAPSRAPATLPAPQPSRTKEKIVRALRKK
jgi:hypothetical protein